MPKHILISLPEGEARQRRFDDAWNVFATMFPDLARDAVQITNEGRAVSHFRTGILVSVHDELPRS